MPSNGNMGTCPTSIYVFLVISYFVYFLTKKTVKETSSYIANGVLSW